MRPSRIKVRSRGDHRQSARPYSTIQRRFAGATPTIDAVHGDRLAALAHSVRIFGPASPGPRLRWRNLAPVQRPSAPGLAVAARRRGGWRPCSATRGRGASRPGCFAARRGRLPHRGCRSTPTPRRGHDLARPGVTSGLGGVCKGLRNSAAAIALAGRPRVARAQARQAIASFPRGRCRHRVATIAGKRGRSDFGPHALRPLAVRPPARSMRPPP